MGKAASSLRTRLPRLWLASLLNSTVRRLDGGKLVAELAGEDFARSPYASSLLDSLHLSALYTLTQARASSARVHVIHRVNALTVLRESIHTRNFDHLALEFRKARGIRDRACGETVRAGERSREIQLDTTPTTAGGLRIKLSTDRVEEGHNRWLVAVVLEAYKILSKKSVVFSWAHACFIGSRNRVVRVRGIWAATRLDKLGVAIVNTVCRGAQDAQPKQCDSKEQM